MRVEVAYALRDRQAIVTLELPPGACVRDAIERSGIAAGFEGVTLDDVGIFGRRVPLDQALRDGDRVEIYRRLLVDPKQARRERAGRA